MQGPTVQARATFTERGVLCILLPILVEANLTMKPSLPLGECPPHAHTQLLSLAEVEARLEEGLPDKVSGG